MTKESDRAEARDHIKAEITQRFVEVALAVGPKHVVDGPVRGGPWAGSCRGPGGVGGDCSVRPRDVARRLEAPSCGTCSDRPSGA